MSYLLGRVADLKAEAAHTSSAPAQQLPQQLGEPAPTSIPTPKMLNPPPYILPSGVPAQPTADQVATPSAQPATQSAAPVQSPGAAQQAARPSAPAGLGMGLPQPPAPAPPSQVGTSCHAQTCSILLVNALESETLSSRMQNEHMQVQFV